MSVISNTTVLVNFALIGQVPLLRAVFGTLYIAHDVYAELEEGVREGYAVLDSLMEHISPPAERGWLQQTSLASTDELRQLTTMPVGLHRGEAASLPLPHNGTGSSYLMTALLGLRPAVGGLQSLGRLAV